MKTVNIAKKYGITTQAVYARLGRRGISTREFVRLPTKAQDEIMQAAVARNRSNGLNPWVLTVAEGKFCLERAGRFIKGETSAADKEDFIRIINAFLVNQQFHKSRKPRVNPESF